MENDQNNRQELNKWKNMYFEGERKVERLQEEKKDLKILFFFWAFIALLEFVAGGFIIWSILY